MFNFDSEYLSIAINWTRKKILFPLRSRLTPLHDFYRLITSKIAFRLLIFMISSILCLSNVVNVTFGVN